MRSTGLALVLLVALAEPSAAQSVERVSFDAAVSATQAFGGSSGDRPDLIVDFTATARIGKGWVGYIRPWLRQASTEPYAVAREIYQAAVQHERSGRVSTRLDVGYILTPIGIGMMDMRPDSNPVTMTHLSYVIPMPPIEFGTPSAYAVASSYPLGAVLTASTLKWDVRGGVMASPPNRTYVLGASSPNPKARPFVVVGGGVTPRTGLRFGVAYGHGEYATGTELATPTATGRGLQMLAVEGEFAVGYTKITAELTRSTLDTRASTVKASEWFVQGVHTLSPHWYLGARTEHAYAPPSPVFGPRPTLHVSEASVGYRLSNDLILKNAVVSSKTYYSAAAVTQYACSVVWAKRFR
ncbi:MAG: hypothetical protein ABL961_13055 [Vicinamibacterales bacterium]